MQKNNNTLMLLAPTVPSVSSRMGISPGKRVNRSNVFILNRRFSKFFSFVCLYEHKDRKARRATPELKTQSLHSKTFCLFSADYYFVTLCLCIRLTPDRL